MFKSFLEKQKTRQQSAAAYLRGQSGSALVETILSLPLLILIVVGVMLTTYLSLEKIWLERATREAAFCVANTLNSQLDNSAFCKKRLRETLQAALPIGRVQTITLINFERRIIVKASLVFGPPEVSGYEAFKKMSTLRSQTELQKVSLATLRGF